MDVRLIAATHKNLESMVQERTREDLYYRLNVVRIETPALRNRMEDLAELVDFMLVRLDKKFATGAREISRSHGNIAGIPMAWKCAGTGKRPSFRLSRFQGETNSGKDLPQSLQASSSQSHIPTSTLNLLRLNSLLQHPPQKEFLMLV